MTAAARDENRRLLPRWRPWRTAVLMREIAPSLPRRDPARFHPAFLSALDEYKAHGGISRASELLAAANNWDATQSEVASAVAEVLESRTSSSVLKFMAESFTSPMTTEPLRDVLDPEVTRQAEWRNIRDLRRRTHSWPHNAFTWVDLARAYFALGEDRKARRCLEVALALDPDNRFVVRSAVRFLVHTNDEEAARKVVLNSNALEVDPWLLSVGVAIGVRSRRSTLKLAKSLIDGGRYSPWHLAELSATIAVLEHENGQERSARRFMRGALVDPTENVLAHVEWASWASHLQPGEFEKGTQPSAPDEALARRHAKDYEWGLAAAHASSWQLDQPFALDAAGLGSWYALEAGDYDLAANFCDVGLVANPKDPGLLNNRAFAAACRWDLRSAAHDLADIDFASAEVENVGCALATAGFVAIRSNDAELGRSLYNRSISLFSKRRMYDQAARAAMNLAAEEKRDRSNYVAAAFSRAASLVRQARDSGIEHTWLRIQADEYLPGDGPAAPPPRVEVSEWLHLELPRQLRELSDDLRDSSEEGPSP